MNTFLIQNSTEKAYISLKVDVDPEPRSDNIISFNRTKRDH